MRRLRTCVLVVAVGVGIFAPSGTAATRQAGGLVAYSVGGGEDPAEIRTITADGAADRALIRPGKRRLRFGASGPEWSPDGSLLLFGGHHHAERPAQSLWYATGSGKRVTRIPLGFRRTGRLELYGWDWSPDGRRVVVAVRRGSRRSPMMYTLSLTGRHRRALRRGWWPRWAGDGRHIVFSLPEFFPGASAPAVGRGRIAAVRPNGRDFRTLTDSGHDAYPTVSPDGRRVVFVRNFAAPGTEWRLIDVGGGASVALTLRGSAAAVCPPRWTPDGTRLAAVRLDPSSEVDKLVARFVTVAATGGGEDVAFTFPGRHDDCFDVAWQPPHRHAQADGDRIASRLPVPRTDDVNGDGRDDLLLFGDASRLPGASPEPPWPIRVVFGRSATTFVDVRSPGPWGYVAEGPYGYGVFSVGDVNGDGRADMLVDVGRGSPYTSSGPAIRYGQSVTGRTAIADGFSIRAGTAAPATIVGIGDVNGDGFEDLAAYNSQLPNAPRDNDTLHVIFGARSSGDVDIFDLGARGTEIRVPRQRARSYYDAVRMTGVGDVDRDGIDDIAVGADWYPPSSCGRNADDLPRCTGRVWVVYGRRDFPPRLGVRELGRGGLSIVARRGRFTTLLPGSVADDLDGDGYDDVLVGADATRAGRRSFVVWGGRRARTPRTVMLARRTAQVPYAAFPVGDFDGDGRGDLVGFPDAASDASYPFRTFLLRGRHWNGVRSLAPRRPRNGHLLMRHSNCTEMLAAGDVNGDGSADLACLPRFFPDWPSAGWAIFGSGNRRPVREDHLGARGFRFGVP